MVHPTAKIVHPHVTSDPHICGGSPIIMGTRFPVRSVVFFLLPLILAAMNSLMSLFWAVDEAVIKSPSEGAIFPQGI